jgi:hypothetical protein
MWTSSDTERLPGKCCQTPTSSFFLCALTSLFGFGFVSCDPVIGSLLHALSVITGA